MAQIVALRRQKSTEGSIAEKLRVSKSAVHQAIVKYEGLEIYKDRKRSERPRNITKCDDILMERIVVRFPTSSMMKIRAELVR